MQLSGRLAVDYFFQTKEAGTTEVEFSCSLVFPMYLFRSKHPLQKMKTRLWAAQEGSLKHVWKLLALPGPAKI